MITKKLFWYCLYFLIKKMAIILANNTMKQEIAIFEIS